MKQVDLMAENVDTLLLPSLHAASWVTGPEAVWVVFSHQVHPRHGPNDANATCFWLAH